MWLNELKASADDFAAGTVSELNAALAETTVQLCSVYEEAASESDGRPECTEPAEYVEHTEPAGCAERPEPAEHKEPDTETLKDIIYYYLYDYAELFVQAYISEISAKQELQNGAAAERKSEHGADEGLIHGNAAPHDMHLIPVFLRECAEEHPEVSASCSMEFFWGARMKAKLEQELAAGYAAAEKTALRANAEPVIPAGHFSTHQRKLLSEFCGFLRSLR